MALDRTVFNAAMDDSGSGLDGDDVDKAFVEDVVLDPVDAEIARLDAALAAPTPASGQITFPATQNPSAGANTLDDYEEGTWTPTDASGAGLTFGTAKGNYVKVGQLVTATVNVTYPSTANGNTAFISLPFLASSVTVDAYGAAFAYCSYATPITASIAVGTTSVRFYTFGGAAVTNANLSGATLRLTASYRTSA